MKWLRSDTKGAGRGGRGRGSQGEPDGLRIDGRSGRIGFIDSVVGGTVVGWALDTEDPESPLEIAIVHGDRVVASGRADAYRSDLADKFEIGGHHGFELPLGPLEDRGSDGLGLRDARTHEALDAPPFSLSDSAERAANGGGERPIPPIEFRVAGVRGVDWVLQVRNPGREVRTELELFDGERAVHTRPATIAAGESELRLPIPRDSFDGQPHRLSLSMGQRGLVAASAHFLAPFLTPWEYLADQLGDSSVGLSHADAERYRSLQLQLRRPVGEVDVAQVMRAHDVVRQTDFARTFFEPLELAPCAEPRVSVVIPVFEHFAETYHCFASLILAYNRTSFEVIIADDCSADETAECEDILRGARVVRTKTNGGFNRNCNHAAAHARGEFVVFLNNDTEVCSGWLDELVEAYERFDEVGLTGSKLLNPDGTLQEAGGIVWGNGQPWNVGRDENPESPEYNYARQVDYLSGAALCIPKRIWDDVGGFSSELEPAYYEDTDLAFKVREAGYTTWYVPDSKVVHYEGRSHGRDVGSGVKRFQTLNASKFKRRWVRRFSGNGEFGADSLHLHKDRGIVSRALVIDYATPTPDTNAGSYAAVQEMKLLQALGMKVTFVPENLAYMGKATDALRAQGIECLHAPFVLSLERLLEQRGREFDLIFVTRFDLADRHLETIRNHSDAKLVLNIADLHFLRQLRAANEGSIPLQEALDTREQELRVLREVDCVVTYSETEKAIILSHNLTDENVMRCPWVCEPNAGSLDFGERNGLLFLGGFKHPPNLEAVRWFVKEVQPRLDLPPEQRKLRVVGAAVPDELHELAEENDDLEIVGFVEDLEEVFATARVFVAPLRSGAGIKGKVIEAMSRGVPIAATPVAVEATGLVSGLSAEITDDAGEFARAIERLAGDRERWESYREAGLATVERQFSWQGGLRDFSRMLDFLEVVHLPPGEEATPAVGGAPERRPARGAATSASSARTPAPSHPSSSLG